MPELKLRVEGDDDVNGKRVNLRQGLLEECEAEEVEPASCSIWRRSIWYWIKLGILFIFIGLLTAAFLKFGPFFMDKVVLFSPQFHAFVGFF